MAAQQSPGLPRLSTGSQMPRRGSTMLTMPQRRGTMNTLFGPPLGPHEMPPRMPAPAHRHATPSGPWPFLDVDHPIDPKKLANPPNRSGEETKPCDHLDRKDCNNCWRGYPQSLYPNWTPEQQKRSRIARIVENRAVDSCTIFYSDIAQDADFGIPQTVEISKARNEEHWEFMTSPRPPTTRLRAMFLDQLSGPVLQMIGTKYNVEPFFWSSSLGWIPSRYQESIDPQQGDHITITLRFIRPREDPTLGAESSENHENEGDVTSDASSEFDEDLDAPAHVIDTQAPLLLSSSDKILVPDLMAVHLVRVREPSPSNSDEPPSPSSPSSGGSSTMISFHPPTRHMTTSAESLHKRLALVGRSVYWSHIFSEFPDPTFVLLALMWYPLYAWDEAFEDLYTHVGSLESNVITSNPMDLTHELHIVHAHLLHYSALLEDFRKSIVFIRDTPNPALDHPDFDHKKLRERSKERLELECGSLLQEIRRLERTREMMARRLKNVMHLGFSRVNIEDSTYMQKLAEATVKDSAAMKQIAYLTMVFLPASFIATVFGMNVVEINPEGGSETLPHYFIITALLTLTTVWTIVAFQWPVHNTQGKSPLRLASGAPPTSYSASRYPGRSGTSSSGWRALDNLPIPLKRALWPVMMISGWFNSGKGSNDDADDEAFSQPQATVQRQPRRWRPRIKSRPASIAVGTSSKASSKLGSNERRRWWLSRKMLRSPVRDLKAQNMTDLTHTTTTPQEEKEITMA